MARQVAVVDKLKGLVLIFAHIDVYDFFNASIDLAKINGFSVKINFGFLNFAQNFKVHAVTVSDHDLDVLVNGLLCQAID